MAAVEFRDLVPASLDVRSCLPRRLHGKVSVAAACFGLGNICRRQLLPGGTDEFGYVRMHSDSLRATMGCLYKCTLDSLIVNRIIRCDGRYVPGVKSKGYQVLPEVLDGPMQDSLTHPKIVARLLRFLQSVRHRYWLPVHHQLLERQQGVRIAPESREALCRMPRNAALAQRSIVGAIEDGRYRLSVGSTRRVYNSFTNLARPLRQHLYCDDGPLVEVDLRNAQYCCLGLLMHWMSKGPRGIHTLRQRGLNDLANIIAFFADSNRFRLASVDFTAPDVYEFVADTQQAVMYERVAEAAQTSRAAAKSSLPRFVLAWRGQNDESSIAFKRLYPTVWQFIYLVNHGCKMSANTIRILQRIESHVVVELTDSELLRTTASPFFTLHDCIVSPEPSKVATALSRTSDLVDFSFPISSEPQPSVPSDSGI